MARYILLRIPDDQQAELLIQDMADYPEADLLTPSQENSVHAKIEGFYGGYSELDEPELVKEINRSHHDWLIIEPEKY